jgi:hypothetical protein
METKKDSGLFIYYQISSMIIGETDLKKTRYSFNTLQDIIKQNQIMWYAVFKKGFEPFYENDEYISGGFYETIFSKEEFQHIQLEKWIQTVLRIFDKIDSIKGIRFRPKKNQIKIQLWSISELDNKILKTIDSLLHFKKSHFELFYPPPLPNHPDISMVEMRGKKLNILRFGLTLSNFFYSKKIWWEIELYPIFRKYYIPHTNMLDIGSNMGTHALLMSEFVSNDSLIFAFEPVYGDIIQKNIIDNIL